MVLYDMQDKNTHKSFLCMIINWKGLELCMRVIRQFKVLL